VLEKTISAPCEPLDTLGHLAGRRTDDDDVALAAGEGTLRRREHVSRGDGEECFEARPGRTTALELRQGPVIKSPCR